jgi:hypothetical protein
MKDSEVKSVYEVSNNDQNSETTHHGVISRRRVWISGYLDTTNMACGHRNMLDATSRRGIVKLYDMLSDDANCAIYIRICSYKPYIP